MQDSFFFFNWGSAVYFCTGLSHGVPVWAEEIMLPTPEGHSLYSTARTLVIVNPYCVSPGPGAGCLAPVKCEIDQIFTETGKDSAA